MLGKGGKDERKGEAGMDGERGRGREEEDYKNDKNDNIRKLQSSCLYGRYGTVRSVHGQIANNLIFPTPFTTPDNLPNPSSSYDPFIPQVKNQHGHYLTRIQLDQFSPWRLLLKRN